LTDDKLETPTNIEPSESAWKIISNEGSTPDAAAFSVMGLLTLLLADSNTEVSEAEASNSLISSSQFVGTLTELKIHPREAGIILKPVSWPVK
jgi:hypothetical protein